MNPSKVKLLSEGENAFEMHDGRSPFKVPKKGLSAKMQQQIRSMQAEVQAAPPPDIAGAMAPTPDAGRVTFGKPVRVTEVPEVRLANPPPVSPVPIGMSPAERPVIPPTRNLAAEFGARRDAERAAGAARAKDPLMDIITTSGPAAVPTAAPPPAPPPAPPRIGAPSAPSPGMADIRGGIEAQKAGAVMGAAAEADRAQQTAAALGAIDEQLKASQLEEKARAAEARTRTDELMTGYRAAQDEMRNINSTVPGDAAP